MSPRHRRSNRARQWDPRWRGVTLDPDFEIREVATPPAQPATPTRTEEERR